MFGLYFTSLSLMLLLGLFFDNFIIFMIIFAIAILSAVGMGVSFNKPRGGQK